MLGFSYSLAVPLPHMLLLLSSLNCLLSTYAQAFRAPYSPPSPISPPSPFSPDSQQQGLSEAASQDQAADPAHLTTELVRAEPRKLAVRVTIDYGTGFRTGKYEAALSMAVEAKGDMKGLLIDVVPQEIIDRGVGLPTPSVSPLVAQIRESDNVRVRSRNPFGDEFRDMGDIRMTNAQITERVKEIWRHTPYNIGQNLRPNTWLTQRFLNQVTLSPRRQELDPNEVRKYTQVNEEIGRLFHAKPVLQYISKSAVTGKLLVDDIDLSTSLDRITSLSRELSPTEQVMEQYEDAIKKCD